MAETPRDAEALRRFVSQAVDRAEEAAGLPPAAAGGPPVLRRP
ncbi:hypothetical protein [Methylobacterium terrae]|nr:hypothetical protein [Methylobacterium terrae]